MRRMIVRTVDGESTLEPADLTELPRSEWQGGSQWMAQNAERSLVGFGDTIEEACDALAKHPQPPVLEEGDERRLDDGRRDDEFWNVLDNAA